MAKRSGYVCSRTGESPLVTGAGLATALTSPARAPGAATRRRLRGRYWEDSELFRLVQSKCEYSFSFPFSGLNHIHFGSIIRSSIRWKGCTVRYRLDKD
ncbi:hypothetical protein M514_06470 [Trichuris suis]|uniref:Uncharacterized protein n=1 Tax=Trichuris suis TaxID=68888 RepID=A0A085N228_9BILA|nr:hypothetical protein M513_06470 [Trichuris suis]KFD63524.1 hypothetical protein M514_06470 [Trichuris suis]